MLTEQTLKEQAQLQEAEEARRQEQAREERKQVHDYMRHSFGLYVQWFTFFGTVNFAILGWLATGKPNKWLATTVAVVLLLNNVIAWTGSRRFLASLKSIAAQLEPTANSKAIPPIAMYATVIAALLWVMVLNSVMWGIATSVFACQPSLSPTAGG